MIPEEWINKQGEGTTVGIVDTGLELANTPFKNKKTIQKKFGNTNSRHGTHVTSTILQFAPKTNIVFAGGVLDSYSKLEEMLEWISEFKLDVLNLSLSYKEENNKIKEILKKIHCNNTIIVSAFASGVAYPCCYPFVLSAGEQGCFNAPMEWCSYFHNGQMGIMRGSSVSTAITSGVCLLGKAIIPFMNKEFFLKTVTPQDVFFERKLKKHIVVKL